jgi:Tol biopolymer transport system component
VDPNHPANQISLGPTNGLTPIAWSRDGSRLLLRTAGLNAVNGDLCVVNADGSQTRLTSDGVSREGSFSPDGKEVVISRQDDGLYVVDAKGGALRLIAKSHGAWWLESPVWSPDGSRIAYAVYEELGPEGTTYEIWTVNSDGTDPRQLVDLGACGTPGGCTGGLAWSPDGSMLAFHSQRGWLAHYPTDRLPNQEIFVVHADGSGLRRISDDGAQPSWSPDGSRIACVRNNGDLVTMAADGSSVIPVEGVAARRLAWNPVVRT